MVTFPEIHTQVLSRILAYHAFFCNIYTADMLGLLRHFTTTFIACFLVNDISIAASERPCLKQLAVFYLTNSLN